MDGVEGGRVGSWGGNSVPAQCPARPQQITGILILIVSKAPETEGKQYKKCFKSLHVQIFLCCFIFCIFVLYHIQFNLINVT